MGEIHQESYLPALATRSLNGGLVRSTVPRSPTTPSLPTS